jgi:hypothetical protein
MIHLSLNRGFGISKTMARATIRVTDESRCPAAFFAQQAAGRFDGIDTTEHAPLRPVYPWMQLLQKAEFGRIRRVIFLLLKNIHR